MTAMEQKENLCRELLENCRNALYSLFPFLDGAFASLPGQVSEDTASLGTDGRALLYRPDGLIRIYGRNPACLRRGCLHILLHLLYLHPFRRNGRNPLLWNLACDMAVEQIIQRENQPLLEIPTGEVKTQCLAILGDRPLSAEQIFGMLEAGRFPWSPEEMGAAFLFDDHGLWDRADSSRQAVWAQVLAYAGRQGRGGRRRGSGAGTQTESMLPVSAGKQDYRTYLRQFAQCREEMELDMDSFDMIYYSLGMERYGNIPLLEPPETREGWKLSQLVIAIDTSGSCSRETVQNFLSETYSILSARENFFRKMEVYLIQCDCLIQSVAVIHSREEWKNYSREITIAGRGGTDFTPVFRYVEGLRGEGKLRDLKALLYFTDGDGTFPREKPGFETAFVFLEENEFMETVPGWAKKLVSGRR